MSNSNAVPANCLSDLLRWAKAGQLPARSNRLRLPSGRICDDWNACVKGSAWLFGIAQKFDSEGTPSSFSWKGKAISWADVAKRERKDLDFIYTSLTPELLGFEKGNY